MSTTRIPGRSAASLRTGLRLLHRGLAVCALFLAFSGVAKAQDVLQAWVDRYNHPSNNWDYGTSIIIDPAGNVYVTGASRGSGTGFDFVTIKYDANGVRSTTWPDVGAGLGVRRYNGPANGDDVAVDIGLDNAGNVFVTGYSRGINTNDDYVTIRYSANGNETWVARFNNTAGNANGVDRPTALAVDPNSGDVAITGFSAAAPTPNNLIWISYHTVKYRNSDGAQLWFSRYNGLENGNEYANDIAIDQNGWVIVTGQSYNAATGDDVTTIKYSGVNGSQLWVRRYSFNSGTGINEAGNAVTTDDARNIYVTGYSRNPGNLSASFITIKYDPAGNQLWAKRDFTGEAWDIGVDGEGNVVVVGSAGANENLNDYGTVKYRGSDGFTLWTRSWDAGAMADDDGVALAIDGFNNVYVTGNGSSVGTGRDYYTIKYTKDGVLAWNPPHRYNGPQNDDDSAVDIAIDRGGNVYVTGQSRTIATGNDLTTVNMSQPFLSVPQSFEGVARFQTRDQSVWRPGDALVRQTHNIFNLPWSIGPTSLGGYFDVDLPSWMGGGEYGADLLFQTNGYARLDLVTEFNGGQVDINYPVSLRVRFPNREEAIAGNWFNVQTNWEVTSDASLVTEPLTFDAWMTTDFNIQSLYGRARAKAAGNWLYDSVLFDTTYRYNQEIPGLRLSTLLGPQNQRHFWTPWVSGFVKIPQVSARGGTTGPGRLGATGEDTFFTAGLDITNLILPSSLSLAFNIGSLDFDGGVKVMQLYVENQLKLQQDFEFQTTPRIRFNLPAAVEWRTGPTAPTQVSNVIEFNAGQTIQIRMPLNANPAVVLNPQLIIPNGDNFKNKTQLLIRPKVGYDHVRVWLKVNAGDMKLINFDECLGLCISAEIPIPAIPLYERQFQLGGFNTVALAPITVAGATNPAPDLAELSLPQLPVYLFNQTTLSQAAFNSFVNGSVDVLVYGNKFVEGIVGSFSYNGRTIPLETLYINRNTIRVKLPNRFRLLAGVGRFTARNPASFTDSNSLDISFVYPTPSLATVGPNLWASDPRLLFVTMNMVDAGTPTGGDSFIARNDYYLRLRELWANSPMGVMGSIDSYFPNFNFNLVPPLPTVYFNEQPMLNFAQPVDNGVLYALLPPTGFGQPQFANVFLRSPGPGGGVSNVVTHTVAAPRPVISEISPSTVVPGDEVFTLRVIGPDNVPFNAGVQAEVYSNYNRSSVVRFNGVDRPTTFISSSELQVELTPADLASAATHQITVFTPSNGTRYFDPFNGPLPDRLVNSGGVSNTLNLNVHNPAPTIEEVSPNVTQVRSDSFLAREFNVAIKGTGFVPTSQVRINGQLRPTRYISSLLLEVAVPAVDIEAPGQRVISITNPTPGGGVSNNGTLTVNAAQPVATLAGSALHFDGVNDQVAVPNYGAIAPTQSITIEFWQRVLATKQQFTLAINNNSNANRIVVHTPWSDGGVYFDFGNIFTGGRLAYAPPEPIIGTWQHFAMVVDAANNRMRIFRNGVLEAEKNGRTPFVPVNMPLLIGGIGFNGNLDEVRIWNRARSQAEIQADMHATLVGNEQGLVSYWRFDEAAGGTAANSAAGPDGTVGGGAAWLVSSAPIDTVNLVVGAPRSVQLKGFEPTTTSLTYAVSAPPTKATISGVSPNLTLNPTQPGADTFEYTALVGASTSTPATVKLNIAPSPLVTATIRVRLQEWAGPSGSINGRRVSVQLGNGPAQLFTLTQTTANTGTFELPLPAGMPADIRVKPEGFLSQRRQITAGVGPFTVDFFGPDGSSGLIAGDTDETNSVDDGDLINLILDFGGPGGTFSGFFQTDANGDGIVDDADLTTIILSFGLSGD